MGLFGSITHGLSHATHNPFHTISSGIGGGFIGHSPFGGITSGIGGLAHSGFRIATHNPVYNTASNIAHSGNQIIKGAGNLGEGLGGLFKSPMFLLAGAAVVAVIVLKK